METIRDNLPVMGIVEYHGYASTVSGGIEDWTFEDLDEPSLDEVVVEVTHCAVGRGDVDFVDRRFGDVSFLVPGHEIVGFVVAVGVNVKSVSLGDRVGVGYQVSSCQTCVSCKTGFEQHCRLQRCLIVDRPGGFATRVRADERFVVPIPENLNSAHVAPLMSSGLTAYSAIQSSQLHSNMEVAVVGLGGMGHVVTQLAHLAGAHVTAVTSKQLLQADMDNFGVNAAILPMEFEFESLVDRFDRIFVTTGMMHDLDQLLVSLKPNGKLIMLGSPSKAVQFSVSKLNDFSSRSISGSYIGSIAELRELLQLEADGKIMTDVRVLPFTAAAEALDQVRSNVGGYRLVLERSLDS